MNKGRFWNTTFHLTIENYIFLVVYRMNHEMRHFALFILLTVAVRCNEAESDVGKRENELIRHGWAGGSPHPPRLALSARHSQLQWIGVMDYFDCNTSSSFS